jgi:hypothetical protein
MLAILADASDLTPAVLVILVLVCVVVVAGTVLTIGRIKRIAAPKYVCRDKTKTRANAR